MERTARTLGTCAVLTAALGARASACLWDDDTLRAEAAGLPGVVEVVTGRFERNPPLYFEVRLARAEQTIAKDPDAFAAYDNAGVACDRLGRGADAIRWMERKAERLARHPDDTEHAYRLHANLGTFLAHDWIRRGADRADTSEMRRGRDEIAEAIRINPDAHFGREKVQLAAMDWILDPPPLTPDGEIPDLLVNSASRGGREDDSELARGLAGLVALGNAWESVDVFHSLAACFGHSANLSELADERCDELQRAGRRSMHPAAAHGAESPKLARHYGYALRKPHRDALLNWYRDARAAADRWNAEREAYMLPLLREGRHPDWDPAFWDDFSPSGDADEPSQFAIDWAALWNEETLLLIGILFVPVSLVTSVSIAIWRHRRSRRRKQAGHAPSSVG